MSPPSDPVVLVLEDGAAFRGWSFGAPGEAFGEAVFNTGMTGYQEVLTDPSYAGQIVVMTAPHQGNYGVSPEEGESGRIGVAAFAVREAASQGASPRTKGSLRQYLRDQGLVGVEGIDTRAVTLRIRSRGAMRAGVSTMDLDPPSLVERTRSHPGMVGADLAASVSTPHPYDAASVVGPVRPVDGRTFRVAVFDFGLKRNILRLLAGNGCDATVFPATTPGEEVLSGGYDGVVLSNGPGDPAATAYGIETARRLLGRIPVFGICLGHQVLALALFGRTFKMPFGHHGVNQPVKDVETGRVAITSHNHGFAVDPDGWPERHLDRASAAPVVSSEFGAIALTHWNLNDGTLEGLRCLDVPATSVQYHPEAAPGPHDSRGVFHAFLGLMS